MVSFSVATRQEVARVFPEKKCCRLAELAALVRLAGTLYIAENQQVSLVLNTKSSPVARKIFSLIKDLYQFEATLKMQRQKRLRKKIAYSVKLQAFPQIDQFLKELGFLNRFGEITPGIKKSLVRAKCCRRSYLRGVFLATGSLNNPENNYHLEIITGYKGYALDLVQVLERFAGMRPKISTRKKGYLVYLKESDQIAAFLNIIEAHQALLAFENIRIMKEMRNQVNRLVNCDTANLKKAVNASLRQIEQIKLIEQTIGLAQLSPRLREVAYLRLANPDRSLRELGELLEPPVGKSGVNHRLRKIEEIARQINKQ